MAGRGTDILLGGNPDVMAEDILRNREWVAEATQEQEALARSQFALLKREGGSRCRWFVRCGTERHEAVVLTIGFVVVLSRQGDLVRPVLFSSLEDDLMRRFGGDRTWITLQQ